MIKTVLSKPAVMRSKAGAVIFIVFLTATCAEVAAQEDAEVTGPLAVENFSSAIWFTTEYMDRGISNTDERPAVQAGVDWSYQGSYLGVWGSNTNYSDAGLEISYYGGYAWEWQGLGLDLGILYDHYPGEDENHGDGLDPGGGQEADYWEASFIITREIEGWLSPLATVTYFYSPDFFGEDGTAHAVDVNLALSLPCEFTLVLDAGYQDVAGDKLSTGYNYLWWQAGISKNMAGFILDLSYHEVDDKDEACGDYLCDARLVFTVSRQF